MTVPAVVSGVSGLAPLIVGAAVKEGADAEVGPEFATASGLARPKSMSLAPAWVSMRLPGLRARCTIP